MGTALMLALANAPHKLVASEVAAISNEEIALENRPAFKVMGTLQGPLADHFKAIANQHLDITGQTHVMLGSQGTKGLSKTDKALLKANYSQGKTILVLHPEKGAIEKTFKHLGTPYPCLFTGDSQKVEMYTISKTPKGIRQETFMLPQSYENGNDKARISDYMRWFADLGKKQSSILLRPAQLSAAEATATDPKNLLDLADQITDVVTFTDVKPEGHYQITTLTVPASVKDERGDIYYYFYVGQEGNFTPSSAIAIYTIAASPALYPKNPVSLLVESPTTTEGQTNVSSSISYSIGGNVGFFGENVTGGVSGSASFSKSVSYNIPDVTIMNFSNKQFPVNPMKHDVDGETVEFSTINNNPYWEFWIKNGALASSSTFEPFVQWLWRIPKIAVGDHKTFPVNMQFVVSTSEYHSGDLGGGTITIHPSANTAHVFSIPVPPDPL